MRSFIHSFIILKVYTLAQVFIAPTPSGVPFRSFQN